MKCGDPVLCYTNPNGKKFYRHFSLASPIIRQAHQTVFNCGKCLHCRKRKSIELAARCVLHASLYEKNCFLTLTYDEKKETYHNVFEYSDIQKFKKRLRQHVWRKHKRRCEIFNVHEYGANGKKHWHLICFNHDFDDKSIHTRRNGHSLFTSRTLSHLWPAGFSTIGDVSEASAMYQTQYMQKDFQYNHAGTNKKSHSKHSGIGRPYFERHYQQLLQLGFIPFGNNRIPLPRYFEKLAHKHYSHFYETINFFDLPHRKALYRPFKPGQENQEIADLYTTYRAQKDEKLKDLIAQWDLVISQYLDTKNKPDFVKSLENSLYDLQNKISDKPF